MFLYHFPSQTEHQLLDLLHQLVDDFKFISQQFSKPILWTLSRNPLIQQVFETFFYQYTPEIFFPPGKAANAGLANTKAINSFSYTDLFKDASDKG